MGFKPKGVAELRREKGVPSFIVLARFIPHIYAVYIYMHTHTTIYMGYEMYDGYGKLRM